MTKAGLFSILLYAGAVSAAPGELVVDESVENMASPRHIRNVHEEISTRSRGAVAIRAAILHAMSVAKGGPWTVEDEGDGFVLAELRYDGNSVVLRIEYDERWVQLKYVSGTNKYVCENVIGDGICYQNYRDYYGFSQNLRGSIERALKRR